MSNTTATIQGIACYLWGVSVYESPNAPQQSANSVKLGSAMLGETNDSVKELIYNQDKFQERDFALKFFDDNKEALSEILTEIAKMNGGGSENIGLKKLVQKSEFTDVSDDRLIDAYNNMKWVNVLSNTASETQKQLALIAVDNAVYEVVSSYRTMQDIENSFDCGYDDYEYQI